ncbi:uncharacterized protein M421DRAFT_67717 [Didymella exigua CBS 183.55]|uniref:Apple domain-containing protein n=1 Tax=Didymella exigua CBS 183.55 TaxID=1150837 RepID=A0A6A5RLQ6_9PLEO|nr:uncharacterized protein M421DRAFT_67717 [Didymella exigua CBS 183.55]KAF1926467.1 hypothetical protein M421DRAFT_67717 [Didymella exigua CBS 183.55]
MRYAIAASAILGAVAAAPQIINVEAALAVPTPTILGPAIEATKPAAVSYNPIVAASAAAEVVKNEGVIEKRDVSACGDALPGGNGPSPASGFADSDYTAEGSSLRTIAKNAATPSGYDLSFQNLLGSSQQIGYLTYKNLDSYTPQLCADACDSEKYCQGFNIFFERDPKFDPKDGCANPQAVTNVKCSLYGYNVAELAATNEGQWRGPQDKNGQAFHVVITGSNGYSKQSKALPTAPGFQTGTSLPGAINAPLDSTDNNYDTYSGMRLFNDNPYDPSLCAAACEAQTTYDINHPAQDGSYKTCNFFTSYVLTKNDVPLGTYCSFYTRTWDSSYAVNTGFWYGSDRYSVRNAASYVITNPTPKKGPTASP